MGLFRRRVKHAVDPRPAISDFWSWWAKHRTDVVGALQDYRKDDVLRMLQPVVTAIDERLTWDVIGSQSKPFGIVVTSAGQHEVRAAAERWRLAAPDDPDVEFFSTRKRDPDALKSAVLNVDGYDFALSEMVVGARADTAAGRVDVALHHPLFTLVDHDHRLQVAFLGLDTALGEAGVERWVGSIGVSVDPPIDAIALSALDDVVSQLAPMPGSDWAAMKGQGPKGPMFAIVRRSASQHSHPLADTHVAVVLGYEATSNGMPADPAIAAAVEDLEARIVDAFGGEGPHAVHVGHITGGGQVVAHFYVDGLEIDPDVVRSVLDTWNRGRVDLACAHDPGWEHVAAFMR